MKPIRKILLATDFSASCQDAIEWATRLRDTCAAETLDVVHVYDASSLELPAPYGDMPGVDQWVNQHFAGLKEQGRSALEELVPALSGECRSQFLEGRPGPAIVEFAKQNQIDLIVLGTHGHKGLDRFLLGSVSAYVLRHAPCPVLTVKSKSAKAA